MKLIRLITASIGVTCILIVAPLACAQVKPPIAGVDRTAFGVYRALAQVAFEFDQRKDYVNAAKVARVLMLVWAGQEHELKPRLESWRTIDRAMDAFAKPLVAFDSAPLDQTEVQATYQRYLEELQKVDQPL
jgi:hypothetical protein